VASSAREESPMLRCSCSEEVELLSVSESDTNTNTIRGEDSPSLSPAYEELIEVIEKML